MHAAGRAYTTVTQWWSQDSAWIEQEEFGYSKRESFVEFLDLPRRTTAPLELAANIHPVERNEYELFASHGWRIVAPEVEAKTPQLYQRYVQGSRGEFGCAKPGYVKGQTGWLSDRTVCYLASGRPCVVQDTAASRHLPDTCGLRFVSTVEDAAAHLNDIEREYAKASAEARLLAEEVFATSVQLPELLRMSGL
jgi:hypothetical protein